MLLNVLPRHPRRQLDDREEEALVQVVVDPRRRSRAKHQPALQEVPPPPLHDLPGGKGVMSRIEYFQ